MKKFFGFTRHGVFVGSHFEKYNHVFHISSEKHELPLILREGRVFWGSSGRYWAKLTFRLNRTGLKNDYFYNYTIPEYIRSLKFFGKKGEEYYLYHKNIQPTFEWSEGFLEKQSSKPWTKLGYFSGDFSSFTEINKINF